MDIVDYIYFKIAVMLDVFFLFIKLKLSKKLYYQYENNKSNTWTNLVHLLFEIFGFSASRIIVCTFKDALMLTCSGVDSLTGPWTALCTLR